MSGAGKPRVVLATDSQIPSGVGEHMLTLAQALRPDWEVALAFPGEGEGAEFLARGHWSGFEVKALRPEGEEGFARWLRRERADLLHVHAGIGWEGHRLARAGQSVGVPVVRTEHLPDLITDKRQRRFYRAGLAAVDHVISVSEAAAASFAANGPATRRATIQNGVFRPKPQRERSATRDALGIEAEAPLLLTVARFTAQKGHADLLRAMREVIGWFPEVRLLLVGEGPDRSAAERMAGEFGIEDHIRFLGARRDVPDLLAASDIFVLPSHFEGLPLVVLEAMAMGLPVVASRIGGVVEALGAEYPWLPEAGAPIELAARIEEVLAHPRRARAIGRANRARFEAQFTAHRMARETAAIYGWTLARDTRRHA